MTQETTRRPPDVGMFEEKARVGVSRDRARRVGLRSSVALSGVGLTLLAGCSAETTGQLKRLGLPEPGTVQAPSVGDLWIGTWIAAGVIGVAVWGIIGWVVLRYRSDHNDMPRQNRYNLPMEIFYTVAPFVVIGVLFYYTVLAQNVVTKNPTPDLTVDVVGQKWAWTFNYESADLAVGRDRRMGDRDHQPVVRPSTCRSTRRSASTSRRPTSTTPSGSPSSTRRWT